MWIYVVGHELTHVVWSWLFGGKVKKFRASSSGGEVVVTKSNFLVALAPYFFPLYELASELDLPICVHLGNGSFDVHDFYDRDTAFTKFKMPTIGAFHSIVYNGIPSLFPKIRWGLIEASANWLPFIVSDLRQRYKKRGKQLPANILAANNIYVACEVSDDFNAVPFKFALRDERAPRPQESLVDLDDVEVLE